MAVVNNLKEIRESRGLLQEDLASATGFCTKTISRVERGERAPSAEFMLRIAAYFNLLGVCQVFCVSFKKKFWGRENLPVYIIYQFNKLLR